MCCLPLLFFKDLPQNLELCTLCVDILNVGYTGLSISENQNCVRAVLLRSTIAKTVSSRERSQVGNRPVNKGSSADDGGIYDNKRFTLACTALVGAPVTVIIFT